MKRLRMYSSFNNDSTRNIPINVNLGKFVSTQELDPKLFIENLSIRSNVSRHAIRISLSMLAGYMIAQLFPFGHSYWILLTILTILKPAYSISRRRNADRLGGTLAGAVLSFFILYYIHSNQVLFANDNCCHDCGIQFCSDQLFRECGGDNDLCAAFLSFSAPCGFQEPGG